MLHSMMESCDTQYISLLFVHCYELLYVDCHMWCRNLMWFRFLEQGMTQEEHQPGAASSASTSHHSEQQVSKYCVQMIPFKVTG